MQSVNKELEKMGVIVDKVDTKEHLEDILDDRGIPIKRKNKYDVGSF